MFFSDNRVIIRIEIQNKTKKACHGIYFDPKLITHLNDSIFTNQINESQPEEVGNNFFVNKNFECLLFTIILFID